MQHPNVKPIPIVIHGKVTNFSETTFGDRLQLNVNGSITIFNLTINDTGTFQVHFKTGARFLIDTFKVTVSDSGE